MQQQFILSLFLIAAFAYGGVSADCSPSGFASAVNGGGSPPPPPVPAICAVPESIKSQLPDELKTQLQNLSSSEVSSELSNVLNVLKNPPSSLDELKQKLEAAAPKLTKLIKTALDEAKKALDKQSPDVQSAVKSLLEQLKQLGQQALDAISKALGSTPPPPKQSLVSQIEQAFPSTTPIFQNPSVKSALGI